MDVRDAIAKQIERLPQEMQGEVLRFATSLAQKRVVGESGSSLRRFARTLDPESARQMIQAIERDCEQVDPDEW